MAIDRTRLLDAVRGLDLPRDQYAVFGSGPLVVRGLRDGGDIDLVVTPALYARLRETPGWTVRRRDDGDEMLAWGDFDVMERLEFPGYVGDVPAMIADAERIDDLPFVRLPELRTFKAALNRPKDHVDLDLIDAALARERTPGDAERERRRQEAARTLAGPGTAPAHAPETPSWTGSGWSFLAGVCTRPRPTFAAARGVRFWGTAYLVLLVAAELNATARVRGHGSAVSFLIAPVAAGIGLLLALVTASVALAVARSVTTETSAGPATTQTAIIWGLCVVPQAVVQLIFGDGAATTVVGAVAALAALALMAVLYAEGFGVSVGRGLGAAIAGFLTTFAAVVFVAFVLAACGAAG